MGKKKKKKSRRSPDDQKISDGQAPETRRRSSEFRKAKEAVSRQLRRKAIRISDNVTRVLLVIFFVLVCDLLSAIKRTTGFSIDRVNRPVEVVFEAWPSTFFLCFLSHYCFEFGLNREENNPERWSELYICLKPFGLVIKLGVWDLLQSLFLWYVLGPMREWHSEQLHQTKFTEGNIDYGTSRLNISLNTEIDGYFEIRTLRECRTDEVFFHAHEMKLLKRAADVAQQKNVPILFLPKAEATRIRNIAKSSLSELSAPAHLASDQHSVRTTEKKYAFCLTYEAMAAADKWHECKLRLLLVRQDLLDSVSKWDNVDKKINPELQDPPGKEGEGARTYYKKRLGILKQIPMELSSGPDAGMLAVGGDVRLGYLG